ncbi:MAG: tetratricopeptide repeat protein [Chloroflexi bacterium]|nr:tetratricopeptide repeat protein [Chloroflexota bacterium]
MHAEFCPSCGFRRQHGDRFCRGCGEALTGDARAVGPIAEAEALVARGLLDDAIARVQRALGEDEQPGLLVAQATLYLRRGDTVKAERSLDRAITIDPGCGVAYAYKGGLHLQTGAIDEGQELLDRALALTPHDLNVRIKRAEFWLRLGVLDRARDELREGLLNGGGSPGARAAAEALYANIEKRRRTSFTRTVVPLQAPGVLKRLFGRTRTAPDAQIEAEA